MLESARRNLPAKQHPRLVSPGLLALARDHHAANRLHQAEPLYRELLRTVPSHPEARFFLALLHFQQGKSQPSLSTMAELAAAHPTHAAFQLNLGVTLQTSGHLAEALAPLRRAVTLDRSSATAHGNLGILLFRTGDLPAATTHLSRALALDPTLHEAADTLGLALRALGHPTQALVCFRKAISLAPTRAAAHNNLGNLLDELGHLPEAVSSYRQAIACDPNLAAAHSNLSNTLRSLGQLGDSEASARRALLLQPDFPKALLNLANTLKDQGRLKLAAETYLHLLQLDPAHALALNNLGETRKEQGRIAEAANLLTRALQLSSNTATAGSNLLYLHAFARDIPPEAERDLATGWEQLVLSPAERSAARHRALRSSGVFPTTPRHGRPLRLGIVSAELGTHAVAEFLEPFLQNLDRSRIHLTLCPTVGRAGPRAERIRSLADAHLPLIGVPDALAAERIRHHGIDVLLDTTGHTANNRLGIFAHRAAPVQVTWIGYWSTTGLTEMDFFLSDPDAQPSTESHFTEALWRLPRLAVCYAGDPTLPLNTWSPDPNNTLWLGSLNKYSKIREETLALWAGVLHALPHARLLLEDRAPDDSETHHRILSTLALHGITPDRVHFEPFLPGHRRHMELYNRIDLALDTLPFNSGTTAFDALWMGVPLIALEGNWTGGRMGSSLLKSLGRPEWIAQNPADYVRIVRELAHALPSNPGTRHQLRQQQRDRMAQSPLCDAVSLTDAVQQAFEQMHDRWLQGIVSRTLSA